MTPEDNGNSNGSIFDGAATTQQADTDQVQEVVQIDQNASAQEQPVEEEAGESTSMTMKQMLMSRARTLGIVFSNNIKEDALREKIQAKMAELDAAEAAKAQLGSPEVQAPVTGPSNAQPAVDYTKPMAAPVAPVEPAKVTNVNPLGETPPPAPPKSLQQQIYDEQMKLVRCRIVNLDPKKKDLPGEVFTIANEYLGTVRKYIPFGEVTDDGYHIPYCLYTMLEERRFLHIRVVKDRLTQQLRTETQYAKEFAIEVLPPLTEAELQRLANAQRAAGSIDGSDLF